MNKEILNSQKRIIFVIGMHRSGTSLVTKAIQVIGADLGNNLMPAELSNPKGYWEDIDVFHFNERLLDYINVRWDIPSILTTVDFKETKFNSWKKEATQLLRIKITNCDLFAIKDPRISLLIPFWESVAKTLTVKIQYVVAVRNPIDSSRSLIKRNNFDETKGLALWVNYNYKILLDLCNSEGSAIFIDYQKLLNQPLKQLSRLSYFISELKITKSSTTSKIEEFINSYIDKTLSHSFATTDDLNKLDQSVLGIIELHNCLQEFTQTRWSRVRALQTLDAISANQLEADNYKLQLHYFKYELKHKLNTQRQSLQTKNQLLIERIIQNKNDYYHEIIQKNDADFQKKILHIIAKKDHETQILIKDLIDRQDKKFMNFSNDLIDKNNQQLNQKDLLIRSGNEQLNKLKKAMQSEIKKHNNSIDKIITQHKHELEEWNSLVHEIHTSYSWKITTPLRVGLNIIHSTKNLLNVSRNTCASQVTSGLEMNASGLWTTIDDDPQFNMDLSKTHQSSGWHSVQFNAKTLDNNFSLYPELYINYGNGYMESEKIMLDYNNDRYESTVFFDQPPTGIRIDPCNQSGINFKLDEIKIKKIPLPLFIATASINIYKRDRNNGKTPLDIILEKINLITKFGLLYTINNLNTLISDTNDGVDWGIDYNQWISEVEIRYHKSIVNKGDKSHTKVNNHAIFVISESLSDPNINLSIKSIQNQLLQPSEVFILHKKNQIYCFSTNSNELSEKKLFNTWIDTTKTNIVTLLKSGDQLSDYYLLALEETHIKSPDYDLVYSDNDEISKDGLRCNPQFKPDWSPDFLIELNYIGETFSIPLHHLRQFLNKYNYPLTLLPIHILYYFATTRNNNIKHISQILVHKTNTVEITRQDNKQHNMLKKMVYKHTGGTLKTTNDIQQYRVSYSLSNSAPKVSIIIPTKDNIKLLRICVKSLIEKTDYKNFEIIIVDNQSVKNETHTYLKKLSKKSFIRVISYNKPFNFSAINNLAVSHSQSEILCFLNNDIEIINSNWLSELVSHAIRPEVGCVGAKLYYPDGRIQHGGVIIGIGGVAAHAFSFEDGDSNGYLNRLNSLQNYSAITAACLVIRKELFCSIGEFNQIQLPVAFNDIDLCLRLREQGYQVIWTPYAELVHHESATRADDKTRSEEIKTEVQFMQIRWHKWIQNDPAYNHHLSLAIGNDFEYSLRQKNISHNSIHSTINNNPIKNPYLIENNKERITTIVTDDTKYQLRYKKTTPGLSIIILTLEKPELIEPLLKNLITAKKYFYSQGINVDIIVGDTGSTSSDVISLYKLLKSEITIVRGLDYHFSRCNNQLFTEYVQYDSVLFLNNDVIFNNASNTLYRMHEVLHDNHRTGIVGSFLTYPDGRLQHGGVSIIEDGDNKGLCYHPGHGSVFKKPAVNSVKLMPAVTGACLLIGSDLFVSCGMFDTHYATEIQDVDLCFQARRIGYNSMLCYAGEVHHLENATRPKGEENNQDRARFVRKWAVFYSEMLS
ncbi:MAG: glycosyltransferase [Methylococcaceae bacterium]